MLILVVDDNELNLQIESKMLVSLGYEVVMADSGLEALRVFNGKKPDAILLDCRMPDMNGCEVSEKIRQIELINDLKRIPIIAVSGNDFDENSGVYIKSGMDGFISKPVDIKVLDKVLKEKIKITDNPESVDMKVLMASADEDDEWAEELLDLFLTDTGVRFREIEKTIGNDNDDELLIRNFHTIKSSASSIGANILSQLAKELEALSREGEFDLVAEKMKSFKNELTQVSRFIKNRGRSSGK